MKFNYDSFKKFTNQEDASKWGNEYYNSWMPQLQDQNYKPQTPNRDILQKLYTRNTLYIQHDITIFKH